MVSFKYTAVLALALKFVSAQTFQRLGACPDLGCVFPPDQTEFLPGQYFDIRVEVHAPESGSEANGGVPDEKFTLEIQKKGRRASPAHKFFDIKEPKLEKWSFSWYEDLFAQDTRTSTKVNVASKAYRRIALYEPGEYTATLTYYGRTRTVANWKVKELSERKKAKNVILFIGDGMTTNMITAARLIGHKSVNGKYQSKMAMDTFPVVGHQMTHSIDTFITDSANSASALYTGHKSTVNAMGVYADSSPDAFDDPKVETIVELLARIWGSAIGVVSTAFIADATPIALTAHTRSRNLYGQLVDQQLNGVQNYTWTKFGGPDVIFGGGAENYTPGRGSYQGKDYVAEFKKKGYSYATDAASLSSLPRDKKALGLFCTGNLPTWIDRNILPENLQSLKNHPSGNGQPATDLPGLKEMTLKAIDILARRGGRDGFFLMSEAASIDKQMHALDYPRALGDLLELDDTIRATIDHLRKLGQLEDTLILVTADHGHGFDVFGSADTEYLRAQTTDKKRKDAIGTYAKSGLSQYTVPAPGISYNTGVNFPLNWTPRYTLAQGVGAYPDHKEDYVLSDKPRSPPSAIPHGFGKTGTIGSSDSQGVHSLTDVPIYARGPCQEEFSGTFDNTEVFFKMAKCLGLGRRNAKSGNGRGRGGRD